MGTRNMTMVVSQGELKVAQYGQWDGYPSGQGFTVLSFLKGTNLDDFRRAIDECYFLTEEERQKRWKEVGADDSGFVSSVVVSKFQEQWPHLMRDMAAEVLVEVMKGTRDMWDGRHLIKDSLCEWAYLIDLDQMTLEVFSGYNDTIEGAEDLHFPIIEKLRKGYFPLRLMKSYPLTMLPDEKTFQRDLTGEED